MILRVSPDEPCSEDKKLKEGLSIILDVNRKPRDLLVVFYLITKSWTVPLLVLSHILVFQENKNVDKIEMIIARTPFVQFASK